MVASFFEGIGMHERAKVRDVKALSKIQRCVPAWTGMALFFDRRVHRISRRSLEYSFVQDAAVDVEAFFRERILRLSSGYIADILFSARGTSVRQHGAATATSQN